MLTLYYFPHACSMASHVALEEAGAVFELKKVNILTGEQFKPAYREINPRAKVPALRFDHGEVLLESTAILGWIGNAFPDRALLGRDPFERAQTIATCAWLSGTVHPTFTKFYHPEQVVSDKSLFAAVKTKSKENYWDHLQEMDRIMEGRTWMMGSHFTVADPYALVFFSWGRDLGLPISELTNLMTLKDRLIERPAARRVLEKEKSVLLSL